MFSRVLEFIGIVDAHLFVTDAERALIRGDDWHVVENASTTVTVLIAARATVAIREVFTMVDADVVACFQIESAS